jgi:hypothetical protein
MSTGNSRIGDLVIGEVEKPTQKGKYVKDALGRPCSKGR